MKTKNLIKSIVFFVLIISIFIICSCGNNACEHSFSDWETVLQPSCTATGFSVSKCELCGLSKTNILEKTSHTPKKLDATEPTCQEKGLTEGKICEVCDEILEKQDSISKVEHNFENMLCTFCDQPYYSKGLNFFLNEDGKSYSVAKGSCKETAVVIPSTYKNLPVVSIGALAFKDCTNVKSIIIPSSIISIDSGAFYGCSSLEKISIPFTGASPSATGSSASLGYIFGQEEFPDAYSAKQFYSGNIVKTYYIPKSLKEIEYTGTNLTYGCFSNCSSVTKISFTNEITKIPDYAFYGCSSLEELPFGFEDTLFSIGKKSFMECESIKKVSLSETVNEIGECAFARCRNITSFLVHPDNEVYQSLSGNLYSKDGAHLIQYSPANTSTSFVVPEAVTHIDMYAFNLSANLQEISFAGKISYIGESAFLGCSALKAFEMPEDVENIFNETFLGCVSLEEITLNNSIITIGAYAFQNCNALKSITLPSTVQSIGKYAFSKCFALEYVYIPKSTVYVEEKILWSSPSAVVYCGAKTHPSSGWDGDWNYYDNVVYWNIVQP